MQVLTIRADANPGMGSGHIMRCLALAQGWQAEGGQACFVAHDTLPVALYDRLLAEGMQVQLYTGLPGSSDDADYLIQQAHDLVVVDGYQFGAAYQHRLKSAGQHILFIDDNGHAGEYVADWVLNQNIHATSDFYAERASNTKL